jgi:type I restriction enzyme M protein
MATKPMTRANLDDFVACYCSGHMQDRVPTYSSDEPNGRWRKFTKEEVYSRDLLKLDFKWMDLGEKDDRTIGELLGDMQTKASAITEAVAKLQDLLGGIEL